MFKFNCVEKFQMLEERKERKEKAITDMRFDIKCGLVTKGHAKLLEKTIRSKLIELITINREIYKLRSNVLTKLVIAVFA